MKPLIVKALLLAAAITSLSANLNEATAAQENGVIVIDDTNTPDE